MIRIREAPAMTGWLQGSLHYRPLRAGDAQAMVDSIQASRPLLDRWEHWHRAALCVPAARECLERAEQAWRDDLGYYVGVFDTGNGRLAGMNTVFTVDRHCGTAGLGYWVRSDYQGRGIATAMTRRTVEYACSTLRLTRLELVIHHLNAASVRVARKIGAHFESRARNRMLDNGAPVDAWIYSVVPRDRA